MVESRIDGTSVLASAVQLRKLASYRGLRVLAWDGETLYGCRNYDIVRWRAGASPWESVARFRPAWWRKLTSRVSLSYRLMRDGFHALAILHDGTMIGAVPGAIVTCAAGDNEFGRSHQILRGTRPLHITATPSGRIYWGEYFDNRARQEVHIYVSEDRGSTWQVAYTFPAGSIRHVHNIVFDHWNDCLWVLTGDEGAECRILRASCDFASVEPVISGSQQARAVAATPTRDALYVATDTPLEKNYIYRLERSGKLERAAALQSSCIYGCYAGGALFFSTMVEPSTVNVDREVHVVGGRLGAGWQALLHWKKDNFPMRYFQYGNAILPDGDNATQILAVTTVAVEQDDLTTTLWQVE